MSNHPWELNEHGYWCPACGNHIAHQITDDPDDEARLPDSCRECGFPDFEDGEGYFTDD